VAIEAKTHRLRPEALPRGPLSGESQGTPMKTAIGIPTKTVKKVTAAVLGLLCAAAWLTAILYFSFTMEF
jgi:hypothetical protein